MKTALVFCLLIIGTTISQANSLKKEPCKDTIYLVSGKTFPVQYIRESARTVRYRSCYTNMRVTKSKKEIIKIVFADGSSSSFMGGMQIESDDRPPEVDKKRKSKDRDLDRGNAFVVTSLVTSALLLLLLLTILV